MDEKKTEQEQTAKFERPSPAEPAAAAKARAAQEMPRRRVGSITLGGCLIAAGVFFLLYYFLPGFDWLLTLKIAPAVGLILLGCEVLFFSLRPGRWKYDFVSVLVCLCLIGCCFCMTLLPLVWAEIDPARQLTQEKLRDEYVSQVYAQMQTAAPGIALKDVEGSLHLSTGTDVTTLEELAQSNESSRYLTLEVELFGPYESAEEFAEDCRALTDAIRACGVQPNRVSFDCAPTADPAQMLETGAVPPKEYYLRLDGAVQMDWTAGQMAGQTEVVEAIEEENLDRTEEIQE